MCICGMKSSRLEADESGLWFGVGVWKMRAQRFASLSVISILIMLRIHSYFTLRLVIDNRQAPWYPSLGRYLLSK